VLAVMESLVPDYVLAGYTRERTGSKLAGIAPSNVYPTSDGRMIILAANQDTLFKRLCEAMGQPELASDSRYVDHASRGKNQEELDDVIARWTVSLPAQELLDHLRAHDVVCGDIYKAVDMLNDSHFAARKSIVEVASQTGPGDIPMQNVFPRFEGTPTTIRWAGPTHGQHTDEVLAEKLGLSEPAIAELRTAGII
jgi:formyl-CoA transferase